MPFVDVAGMKLYYEALAAGSPLVMVPGYGQYSLQWGGLPGEFAKLNYQVILVDNRGTGRSDKQDAPVTIAGMADDICRVLDALSLDRASIFGASMGGMIAQEFALNHADRLNNLILGCTSAGGANSIKPDSEGMKILFDYDYLNRMTPEQRSREVFRFLCSDSFIEQYPEYLKQYHLATIKHPTPLITFKRQAEAVAAFDTWDRLEKITAPTLIITGTEDRIMPYQNSQLLNQRIPGSELTLLKGKGHGFYIEGMDSTRVFVNDFMKRHGAK